MNIKNVTKKVLLMVCSIALVGGVFSSCKDNTEDILAELNSQTNDINSVIDELSARIDTIDTELEEQQHSLDSLKLDQLRQDSIIDTLETRIDTLESKVYEVDSIIKKMQLNIDTLDFNLDSLCGVVDTIQLKIDTIWFSIDSLRNRIVQIENVLAKQVTGIIIQGVENPIFGSFSLPIGMNSNILLGYYGESERDYDFPSNKSGMDATGIADAYKYITINGDSEVSGILFNDTLGTVYLTINPAKTDFTGLKVGIENSIEESNGMSVTPLKESKKKLSFGYSPYTKSVSNGLYEAKVYLDSESSIDLIKFNIEDGLKSSVKDILESFKTGSKQVDITELSTSIAKQITNFLDAYALNVEWKDTINNVEKERAVYSNYNLAATAFKPLSYTFLKGQSVGKLPVINEFDHIDLGEINLDLKLNFTPIAINSNVNIDIKEVDIDETGINVTVDVPEVDGGVFTGNTIPKKVEISNLITEIEKQLNSANTEVETEIKKQLETQIKSIETEINKYLKDMIADINGQLGNVDDLVDQFNGVEGKVNSAIDKVNSFVSRVNNLTSKINTRLDNLNAYLQVTMLYETADGDFAQLSNSRAGASQIVAGKDAVLYPTSYTADIVVPAYKKYIAFTEVIGLSDSEQADKLSQLNTGDYLNTVLEGNTKAIKLNIPSSFSGKTLELTYSALDYSGYTSTRKFYIYVK